MENNPFPLSITKDEVNELPLIQFSGRAKVIDKKSDLKQAVKELEKYQVLGFDTETRPSFKKGDSYSVALLQLSAGEQAYLFRLNKIGFGKELCRLLENQKIIKVGVAIRDDLKGLQKLHPFEPQKFIELADVASNLKVKNLGLRNLAGIFLGKRISKGAKLTNWEAPKLTQAQVTYAATDAWIGREIYLNLKERDLLESL